MKRNKPKLGKYSKPLTNSQVSKSPHKDSHAGYSGRKSLMGEMSTSAPRSMSPNGTATGKPVPVRGK